MRLSTPRPLVSGAAQSWQRSAVRALVRRITSSVRILGVPVGEELVPDAGVVEGFGEIRNGHLVAPTRGVCHVLGGRPGEGPAPPSVPSVEAGPADEA